MQVLRDVVAEEPVIRADESRSTTGGAEQEAVPEVNQSSVFTARVHFMVRPAGGAVIGGTATLRVSHSRTFKMEDFKGTTTTTTTTKVPPGCYVAPLQN